MSIKMEWLSNLKEHAIVALVLFLMLPAELGHRIKKAFKKIIK